MGQTGRAADEHGASDAQGADASRSRRFQTLALPHLDAAYNLARWLSGNANDADDIVQEAFMRAFRFFDSCRGDSVRPWLLAIVRRTWYTEWNRRAAAHEVAAAEELEGAALPDDWRIAADDPETMLIRGEDARRVRDALVRLPAEYREVLVLREMEDLSYREIAAIADVPVGTVMSRLSRARRRLAAMLADAPRGTDARAPRGGCADSAGGAGGRGGTAANEVAAGQAAGGSGLRESGHSRGVDAGRASAATDGSASEAIDGL
ncbi:RNA polymerase, sigma-24 subunit, ECF subfamily [Burkholderia sp. lig30]|uniref:RNA polymerase sigma factor n=1 Tax=Burkholderia sp. lig30 TaxID=1192124 RepID=UPI000461FE77|nr:RNA polymerase sigma factor [Burkholderia sp. lig30]KDB06772.1 RNA polymerase, sigma-24 subunit, ECF subfamily [Burkholderia sp. lig30]